MMLRILDLCKMPRLPSEVLHLPDRGIPADACLDFDLGFLDFKWWFEGKQNETVMATPQDHKGKVPMPKYRTVEAILAQYDITADPEAQLDRIAEERQQIDAAIDDFMATMEPEF